MPRHSAFTDIGIHQTGLDQPLSDEEFQARALSMLYRALNIGHVTAFTGSGVSRNYLRSDWSGLTRKIRHAYEKIHLGEDQYSSADVRRLVHHICKPRVIAVDDIPLVLDIIEDELAIRPILKRKKTEDRLDDPMTKRNVGVADLIEEVIESEQKRRKVAPIVREDHPRPPNEPIRNPEL